MSRTFVFALMATGLLSACGGQFIGPDPQPAMSQKYSNSVGFTGVGYEPY